jgi:hypothetical protein
MRFEKIVRTQTFEYSPVEKPGFKPSLGWREGCNVEWKYRRDYFVEGKVSLEVDVDQMFELLGSRVLVNKGGKAVEAGGRIKATRINVKEVV